jgi:hypothetical protein
MTNQGGHHRLSVRKMLAAVLWLFADSGYTATFRPHETLSSLLPEPSTIASFLVDVDENDTCEPDPRETTFIVHWTHVPKAGGTSFADMSKAIACAKNPHLSETNPCCHRTLCLAPNLSCHASASSCPLVTGIGRHSSNMDRMLGVPCCGSGWSMVSSLTGFMAYAIKGENNWREAQYKLWPLEVRVLFLSQMGARTERIIQRLKAMRPPLEQERLDELVRIAETAPKPFESTRLLNDHLLGCSKRMAQGKCCLPKGSTLGSNSLTMIRHPFMRSISGFYYRGHNPNFDVFQLRPGMWFRPTDAKPKFNPHPARWTFEEFQEVPEYQNVMTKMFGASKNCDQISKCHAAQGGIKNRGGACLLTSSCHGYRNGTFLNPQHLSQAKLALQHHRFVGLVEAYNSSILLLGTIFNLTISDSDYAQKRKSSSDICKSTKSKSIQTSKESCLRSMAVNEFDAHLYEHAHRLFCRRLDEAKLMHHPIVVRDLGRSSLCGSIDFSDPKVYCEYVASDQKANQVRDLSKRCKERHKRNQVSAGR